MSIRMLSIAVLAPLFAMAGQAHAQREGGRTAPTEVRGIIKSADANSITITMGGGGESAPTEKTYAVAKDVEIAIGGGGFRSSGIAREGKIKDLITAVSVSLTLSADQKTVESILAEEPLMRGTLKAIDVKKRTLTVTGAASGGRGGEERAAEDRTLSIAADVEVGIDDGRGRRFSIHEGKLEDLNEGAIVTLRLSLDKSQVHGIFAEGATVQGVVKSIDAGKRSLTLTTRAPGRGEDAGEERTLIVAKEAVILLDNGKVRRLSVKEAKLADVPIGAMVSVKLSVDQSFVMMLKAEGPQVLGMLKAVDADKRTVTVAIPKSRTEFDEFTYTLAKDALVTFDGKTATLADIKIGE